ncbi:FAD-binding protein [Simiduia agarivorans]|uniref:Glycolate oxidase FAD binding subunit n=1 Tax=Simiduia agarivorans (strain DSM 21679 / JCM 13881 / BCRC 17597 / SA1) TaxID=1117647 RepID=K4KI70_SIMAS|nr:FAD-binding protein [Simiduia agarivorans]AFU98706.1 glycolate oxidase FAD binding subunit [Simiduia agarivorans SA1 = DSM 21679]
MSDLSLPLVAAVNEAVVDAVAGRLSALRIAGNGTRITHPAQALPCADHSGIIQYQPEELVVRVRGGTRLSHLQSVLAEQGQRLVAEWPQPDNRSTVGGAIAMGLEGAERSVGFGLRDSLLGCQLINGLGERVRFGGQVVKNVAGYDLTRLQVGAMGSLGVLLDVSLKLRPLAELTQCFVARLAPMEAMRIWQHCQALLPFYRGGFYWQGQMVLRFEGRAQALNAIDKALPDDFSEADPEQFDVHSHWQAPVFRADSLASLTFPEPLPPDEWLDHAMVDWEGRRFWLANANHHALASWACKQGGQLRVWRGIRVPVLGEGLSHWHSALKQAFDPHALFNPVLFQQHLAMEARCN